MDGEHHAIVASLVVASELVNWKVIKKK